MYKRQVFESEFENVKAWSHEDPDLYMLNTVLTLDGEEADDLIERVGFRTVEVRDTKISVSYTHLMRRVRTS